MFSILLPAPVVGALTFILMIGAVLFWGGAMIMPAALVKLIPYPPLRRACSRWAVAMASGFAATTQMIYRLLHPTQWQLDIRAQLDPKKNYLLVCNHQSWTDILILFDVLHRRVPLPRFFLKQQLMYVPIIGIGCWAMDFPFMKRHSREAIAANPALRNEDLEATRRACEIYKTEPVVLVNFLEGTRFTEAKRVQKQSPHRHLLRPKAAGMSFTLNAMGEQFDGIIDMTIAYNPTKKPLLWSWLSGDQDNLALHLDLLPIPPELMHGDYDSDARFRERFQHWVNELWQRKDARLERMLDQLSAPPARPAHHF